MRHEEYRLFIDYGGRDGIVGTERRDLGEVSAARARVVSAELLRDHAVRVTIEVREAEDWEELLW